VVDVLAPAGFASAGTNWLIAGSDSRSGLTRTEEDQLALGHDISGGRTDTIMLLHLPANGTRPTLVSIPRDSYVPIPGHGENKINAAYSLGGPKLLIQTVRNVTGLRIDHYMGIGFGDLVDVVNDVGGVTLCLPGPMKDPKAGLNPNKGCQTLDGDLQREQELRALLKSLLSSLTIDQGASLSQLASVAFALKNPVTTMVPFGGFGNTSAGSVVEWNVPEGKVFFNDLATDKPLAKNLITGASVAGTT
jgi:LCP family protein required for cell wall assembly